MDEGHSLFEFIINSEYMLSIQVNIIALLGIIVTLLILLVVVKKDLLKSFAEFEVDETELGIGNHKIKLSLNKTDTQIAYKIWVELSTRKIGLEVDLDKDLFIHVYSSWYEFFKITRELIKEVPAEKLKREDTRKIVNLSIMVLNSGVRPHLTQWHAKFRRWYEVELVEEKDHLLSPQDIQKKYPLFNELCADLVMVNQRLIKYKESLTKLVVGLDLKEQINEQ